MRIVLAGLLVLAASCAQPPALPTSQFDGVGRVAGQDRVGTAVAVSARFWESSASVVLATADDFPDALAAAALAARLRSPILLTPGRSLAPDVAAEIERVGASSVVVVGGRAAVSEAVEDELRARGLDVRRVAGADRYATAALLAGESGEHDEVVLASGTSFADALAAAPRPVLLAQGDELPTATAEALEELAVEAVTLVGGEGALSERVAQQVRGLGIPVRRLAGADRYATALAVLEAGMAGRDPPVHLAVAGGAGFADALSAGPLAALAGGAVALAPPERLTDGLDGLLRRTDVGGIVIVGGGAAVGPHVESELAAAVAGTPRPTHTVVSPGGFRGTASPLPDDAKARMDGVSWREGCPVGLEDLAYLSLDHHDLDGDVSRGELVVSAGVAGAVLQTFSAVFEAGFPIARMTLVDDYGGDDGASMDANNTSAFNCRPVEGGTRWSEHAYGTAIDINPVQNPYRRGQTVLPEAGRAYLDRADVRPGMIVRPGPVVDAFAAIGWGWGGDWSSLDDWMHFSASGR